LEKTHATPPLLFTGESCLRAALLLELSADAPDCQRSVAELSSVLARTLSPAHLAAHAGELLQGVLASEPPAAAVLAAAAVACGGSSLDSLRCVAALLLSSAPGPSSREQLYALVPDLAPPALRLVSGAPGAKPLVEAQIALAALVRAAHAPSEAEAVEAACEAVLVYLREMVEVEELAGLPQAVRLLKRVAPTPATSSVLQQPPPPPPPQHFAAPPPPPLPVRWKPPIEQVVDDLAAMGFAADDVRSCIRSLTTHGRSVDLNDVIDHLMSREERASTDSAAVVRSEERTEALREVARRHIGGSFDTSVLLGGEALHSSPAMAGEASSPRAPRRAVTARAEEERGVELSDL